MKDKPKRRKTAKAGKKTGKTSIGIDIGKRKCAVCVMDEDGGILEETSYGNTQAESTALAARLKHEYGKGCRMACESTGNMWIKTFHAFEAAGIPSQLANTFKLKIISELGDAKTDRIDARKIADTLRIDKIPRCYVVKPEQRAARDLLRYRITLVQDRTKLISKTRSHLDKYDVNIEASKMYSKKAIRFLSGLDLGDANDDMVLQSCVRRMSQLTGEINDLEKEIGRQAALNEHAVLLMSMTGIDSFAAMLLMAEIGDHTRFATPEGLVSWTGMCPTVHQSGDSEYHGRMKKKSNRRANWIMLQAANTAIRHDPRMRGYYEGVMKRHGQKHAIAVTHVANKMIRIIWAMLHTNTPYKTHNKALYGKKLGRISAKAPTSLVFSD